MSGEPTNSNRRKSRSSAKAAKPKDIREKVTLLLSRDTNVKLSTLAALKGVDRSTQADAILSEALRHVVIALRGPLAEGSGGGEGEEAQPSSNDEVTDAA